MGPYPLGLLDAHQLPSLRQKTQSVLSVLLFCYPAVICSFPDNRYPDFALEEWLSLYPGQVSQGSLLIKKKGGGGLTYHHTKRGSLQNFDLEQ